MTYFAPRQGLFAVVIVLSFIFHLLCFVLGQQYQLTQQYKKNAEHDANIIAKEIAVPLQAKDRVSMSVIVNRYIEDDNVEFIGIYDAKETLLVPVGTQNTNNLSATTPITVDNQVLGSVVVQAKTINRSLIISDNWIYLVSALVLHLMIYLLYGYLARPSTNMLKKINEDMRLRLLNSGMLENQSTTDGTDSQAPLISAETDSQTDNATQPTPQDKEEKHPPKDDSSHEPILPPAEALPFIPLVAVQIRFEDPNDLLGAVSHHTKSAYFNLCNQILVKAAQELLKLPVLSGVSLYSLNDYDDNGTTILLKADNRHGKATTAGIMLARVVIMINQIVYNKHRQLKRFCLTTRAMVSDFDRQKEIVAVSKNHRERVLVLVPEAGVLEVKSYVTLDRLTNPRTAFERQSYYLKLISESTNERLNYVCDKVLLLE